MAEDFVSIAHGIWYGLGAILFITICPLLLIGDFTIICLCFVTDLDAPQREFLGAVAAIFATILCVIWDSHFFRIVVIYSCSLSCGSSDRIFLQFQSRFHI